MSGREPYEFYEAIISDVRNELVARGSSGISSQVDEVGKNIRCLVFAELLEHFILPGTKSFLFIRSEKSFFGDMSQNPFFGRKVAEGFLKNAGKISVILGQAPEAEIISKYCPPSSVRILTGDFPKDEFFVNPGGAHIQRTSSGGPTPSYLNRAYVNAERASLLLGKFENFWEKST